MGILRRRVTARMNDARADASLNDLERSRARVRRSITVDRLRLKKYPSTRATATASPRTQRARRARMSAVRRTCGWDGRSPKMGLILESRLVAREISRASHPPERGSSTIERGSSRARATTTIERVDDRARRFARVSLSRRRRRRRRERRARRSRRDRGPIPPRRTRVAGGFRTTSEVDE